MMALHVCQTTITSWAIRRFKCCECGGFKMLIVSHEWHGPNWYCMRCGDKWECEDGFIRVERPFARGWRKKEIARLEKWVEELKRDHPTGENEAWLERLKKEYPDVKET